MTNRTSYPSLEKPLFPVAANKVTGQLPRHKHIPGGNDRTNLEGLRRILESIEDIRELAIKFGLRSHGGSFWLHVNLSHQSGYPENFSGIAVSEDGDGYVFGHSKKAGADGVGSFTRNPVSAVIRDPKEIAVVLEHALREGASGRLTAAAGQASTKEHG